MILVMGQIQRKLASESKMKAREHFHLTWKRRMVTMKRKRGQRRKIVSHMMVV